MLGLKTFQEVYDVLDFRCRLAPKEASEFSIEDYIASLKTSAAETQQSNGESESAETL